MTTDETQLFSASAVMESRQSRILSENVKLLTFVSIFFLPLGFSIVSTIFVRHRYVFLLVSPPTDVVEYN